MFSVGGGEIEQHEGATALARQSHSQNCTSWLWNRQVSISATWHETGKVAHGSVNVEDRQSLLDKQGDGGCGHALGHPVAAGGLLRHNAVQRLRAACGRHGRSHQYLETSFMPGRKFRSPDDFNTQPADWLPIANSRVVRRICGRPIDLVSIDTAAMLSLPPVPPLTAAYSQIRLPRDYHVRVHGNDYSVDPWAIGHLVEVAADLRQVAVTREGRVLAEHERRWSRGLTVTDPLHVKSAARLREQFQNPTPAAEDQDRLMRDLGDYDRAFGVEFPCTASCNDDCVQ